VSPLERLLAEDIPTRPPAPPKSGPLTPADRDANWNKLCASVGATGEQRPTRHLHAVPRAA